MKKVLLKQALILIVLLGCVFYVSFSARQKSIQNNQNNLVPLSENIFLPVRFAIPNLNVDASVEYVGLTSDGAMDVPQEPDEVAWFNLGTRPGENGSAVIAGHSGFKDNKPAVFDELYKLQKGDKIYVTDGKGITLTFVVRELRDYDPKANAEDVFGSNDGKSHLNLITCIGTWNYTQKTHATRLVVFTDRE